MTPSQQADKFYMAGTEGTGQYVVLAAGPKGRIGVRDLGHSVRIRVEPINTDSGQAASQLGGKIPSNWKRPSSDQFRFSCVASKGPGAVSAVKLGLQVLHDVSGWEFNASNSAQNWETWVSGGYASSAPVAPAPVAPAPAPGHGYGNPVTGNSPVAFAYPVEEDEEDDDDADEDTEEILDAIDEASENLTSAGAGLNEVASSLISTGEGLAAAVRRFRQR